MNNANNRIFFDFTIVEPGIVLLIIGALPAAIMAGRDVVRGAQIKKFQQQFVMEWVNIAGSYYDKTGSLLGDGAVNGGFVQSSTPDGKMDGGFFFGSVSGNTIGVLNSVGIDVYNLIKTSGARRHSIGGHFHPLDECGDNKVVSLATVTGEYAGTRVVYMIL